MRPDPRIVAVVSVSAAIGACATNAAPPGAMTVKALVLNYDPRIASHVNRPLHDVLGWNDPRRLADQYAADVVGASAGHVRFAIVDWHDVDAFHRKADGFLYTTAQYLDHHRRGGGWHEPDMADYRGTFREHDIPGRVSRGEIDEVWVFGGPYFGYSEAAMAGPGAFDINGAVFDDIRSTRPFAIMGFNYERGVAEMLEDLCHRTEATMSRVFGGWRADALDHDWARFAANERQSGTAAVGSCHWPPNAESEYDFANPRSVPSTADDWRRYPTLTGRRSPVSRDAWGGPDYARNYFKWWFAHLPRAEGTGPDGRARNWWKYIFDFASYDARGHRRR